MRKRSLNWDWPIKLGEGVEENFAQTALLYGMAAQQGYADAEDALGNLYRDGLGVPEDDFEALKWYTKAAAQGLANSQSSIGLILESSDSVPHDLDSAAKWYRLAAEQGDEEAQFHLGMLYHSGEGVHGDENEAYKWVSKAYTNSDGILRDDEINELYEIADALPVDTKLDPPLPPEPFSHKLDRIWQPLKMVVGYLLVAWFGGAIIWVILSEIWRRISLSYKHLTKSVRYGAKALRNLADDRFATARRIIIVEHPKDSNAKFTPSNAKTIIALSALVLLLPGGIINYRWLSKKYKLLFKTTCSERALTVKELVLVEGKPKYSDISDGNFFIDFYNGNEYTSVTRGKITFAQSGGKTRTYSFDDSIPPLTASLAEIKVILDDNETKGFAWRVVEAFGCEK
jgi:Sel1 repeat